jgi:DNA (cytosine-5)-methyltransferase 1
VPPLPVCHERYVVDDLLRELERHNSAKGKSSRAASPEQEFLELELSEFVMYLPNNRHHPYELWSLQDLASKSSCSTMLFDGILRVGDVQRYVQAVPFDTCSIGNYGEDIHDVGENIWIRSTHLANSEIYYRLKSPASEYARFYSGFLWLANLAKHFVDYSQWAVDMKMQVSVFNFRTDFSQWVQRRHGMSSSFQLWYQKHQSDDFRQAVAANIHFLFKESIGVNDKFRRQPIWNELLEKEIVPIQEIKE